jgi:hypothetical protein
MKRKARKFVLSPVKDHHVQEETSHSPAIPTISDPDPVHDDSFIIHDMRDVSLNKKYSHVIKRVKEVRSKSWSLALNCMLDSILQEVGENGS